ncbi:MAG: hypothetical protein RL339_2302, partial [Pseudomonadota bacterium]
MRSPTIARVRRGELCTGCGLCAGLSDGAFTLAEEAPGYLRPPDQASLPARTERLIAAACPGSRVAPWTDE